MTNSAREPAQPVFFYDLADPECYLAAERIMAALPIAPEWEPVLGPEIVPAGRPAPDLTDLARRVAEAGLQELRWPSAWPPDSRQAMLAATYAKAIGRAVAFSLAAFRQAFAGGRDLDDEATILIAAAACEVHPAALLKGMTLRSVPAALARANQRAIQAGVDELPAVLVDGVVCSGEGAVEEAAERLGSAPSPSAAELR